MRTLIAIAALVACSGAWAGNIEKVLTELVTSGVAAYVENKEAEKQLKVQIMLYRFGPECDRLAGGNPDPESGMCGEVPQPEVFVQSQVFADETVEQFKKCWNAADELSTGDETEDARGQCKYELEASEREYDAWMAEQDSAS